LKVNELLSLVWLGQTRQQNVSEAFGVAHTIEASDFDQLAPEDSLQAFVALKVYRKIVTFNR